MSATFGVTAASALLAMFNAARSDLPKSARCGAGALTVVSSVGLFLVGPMPLALAVMALLGIVFFAVGSHDRGEHRLRERWPRIAVCESCETAPVIERRRFADGEVFSLCGTCAEVKELRWAA